MKYLALTIFCLLLVSCGRGGTPSSPADPELQQRAEMYRQLVSEVQDEHGFIYTHECDSTLFSGLLGAAGVPVDLTAAEDPEVPGRWYRRPVSLPECWESGKSRSTISRDMLLGVFWWAWVEGRLDVLERIWDYGERRSWFMGDGRLGGFDTLLVPTHISTLAQLIYRLGGEDRTSWRLLPVSFSSDCEGFKCHIRALHIALRHEAYGETGYLTQRTMFSILQRNPGRPLLAVIYQSVSGARNYGPATRRMAELPYYPISRLPDERDTCELWPQQRDRHDSGLRPCPGRDRQGSGGDIIFTEWLTRRPGG